MLIDSETTNLLDMEIEEPVVSICRPDETTFINDQQGEDISELQDGENWSCKFKQIYTTPFSRTKFLIIVIKRLLSVNDDAIYLLFTDITVLAFVSPSTIIANLADLYNHGC